MAIQQLTQPIINPISAFDSKKAHIISFIVIGGAQVIGNRLVIRDNQTGKEIYNKIQSTMKLEHLIPANTLINGGYYNAVVYTIDSANNESMASTAVPFYCYSQPNLTIDNIPATETIENGTYRFIGSYLQKENELLNSYQYTLYDSNKNILSQSALIYYDTDSSLSYTFVGMSNDTAYYIELSGETVNGTKITSGLKYFTVRYLQPASFAICDLVNNCENGYIQISSNIVAIDGKSNPDPPIYIDDKEVDLRDPDSWVEWNSGFRIQDDFTMRVWGRDFTPYENIITLSNDLSSSNNPNKIEMKWMIGDTIKKLPTYKDVSGYNVNLEDSKRAPIKNLSIKGETRQKTDSGRVINEGEGYVTLNPASGKNLLNVPEVLEISIFKEIEVNLEANNTYTFKFDNAIAGSDNNISRIAFRNTTDVVVKNLNTSTVKNFEIQPTQDITNIRIYASADYSSSVGKTKTFQKLMIYEGTDDASYEPFGYIPSSDFPCNISIIPGGNSIQKTTEGKNLINSFSNHSAGYSTTANGVTFTLLEDGKIRVNGTATSGRAAFTFSIPNTTIKAGNYILSRGSEKVQVEAKIGDTYYRATGSSTNVSITEAQKIFYVTLIINEGLTVNNEIVYAQLEKEKGTIATGYEPYTGGIPSPNPEYPSPIQNIGNNINILNKNNIFSKNGVKTEILETGIRIIDISQAKYEFISIPLGGKELLGKNITCYSDVFENKNIYSNAELFFGNDSAPTSGGVIQKQNVSSSITWNIPSSFPNGSDKIRIYLYISGENPPSSGYSVDYTNLKVEIGDTPTNYSPYGLGNISTVISNKNVFNLKRLIEMSSKYSKIENGYKFSSTQAMYSKGVSCLYPISLPISMSYKIQNLTGTGFRFKFWFDNGETESLNAYSSGTSSEETNIVINNYTKSRCETNCKNRY